MTDIGRMLIVDDEAPVRELLSDYFVERRFTVNTAADGQEALAAFARERPDVVLLDVRMPRLDGLSVLRRLREADPGVAVIMVTAVHSARPFAGTTEAAIPVLAAAREALADLPAAARSVIEAALETAEAALTRWGA